jgi:hypothetical protein
MFSSAKKKKKKALCILFICLESDFLRKHKVEKLKENRGGEWVLLYWFLWEVMFF